MTADEIMHALRLTAMGRIGAPEQQRLCEMLELMAERVLGAAARDPNLAANIAAKAEAIGGPREMRPSDAVMRVAAELKADIERMYPEAVKRTRKAKAD